MHRLITFRSFMLFLALLALTSFSGDHKFYISKTIIEFNPRTAQFEVTCKLFTDDLETAIGGAQSGEIRLGTDREVADADQRIEKYMHDHLALKINGAPIEWRWVGKDVDSDMTFCYVEFYRQPDFATLQVFNDILVSQFADQQNIVDLSINGTTQTLVFNKDVVRQEFRR